MTINGCHSPTASGQTDLQKTKCKHLRAAQKVLATWVLWFALSHTNLHSRNLQVLELASYAKLLHTLNAILGEECAEQSKNSFKNCSNARAAAQVPRNYVCTYHVQETEHSMKFNFTVCRFL